MEFMGRSGRNLAVICEYQVCQSSKSGPQTAFHQQYSQLRKQGVADPSPRRQFIIDLSAIVSSYRQKDYDIILMGDFNEVIGLKSEMMASVLTAGNLSDIQIYCHGLESEESTYARGPNRLDYVFASD